MKHIPPIDYYPNAPALYGQGLGDYEILVRICRVINDCIDKINNFQELADEIKKLIDGVEPFIKEQILKTLEKMFEDGTLADFVANIINQWVVAKIATPVWQHAGRHLFFNGYRWSRGKELIGKVYKGGYVNYDNCQGGMAFDYNGKQCFAAVMHGTQSIGATPNGYVLVWTEQSHNTIVRQWAVSSPHCQSLVYNPGDRCLYVPKFTDSQNNASGVIYRFNMDTQVKESKNITVNGSNVRWYSVKVVEKVVNGQKTYQLIGFRNHGNNNRRDRVEIYLIDWESGTASKIDEINTPPQGLANGATGEDVFIDANLAINDNYILLVSWRPSRIYLFLRSTSPSNINAYRDPIWIYNIPQILDEAYLLGEPEDLHIDNDGNVQLITTDVMGNLYEPSALGEITTAVRWFKTSITRGVGLLSGNAQNNDTAGAVEWARYPTITMHVDYDSDTFNPTGRYTEGKDTCFMIAQEAVNYILTSPFRTEGKVILENNNPVPVFINGSKAITMEGKSITDNGVSTYAFQSGIYCTACNLLLRRIRVTQSVESDIFGSGNACIYCRNNGRLILANTVQTNKKGYSGDISVPYDVTVVYGEAYINNIETSGQALTVNKSNSNVTIVTA